MLPLQEAQIWFLVRELRSRALLGLWRMCKKLCVWRFVVKYKQVIHSRYWSRVYRPQPNNTHAWILAPVWDLQDLMPQISSTQKVEHHTGGSLTPGVAWQWRLVRPVSFLLPGHPFHRGRDRKSGGPETGRAEGSIHQEVGTCLQWEARRGHTLGANSQERGRQRREAPCRRRLRDCSWGRGEKAEGDPAEGGGGG